MFPRELLGQATFFHYDTWMQNLTFRAWWFDQLRHGHFATWCPGMFAGYPLFAETQTGPLYPPVFVLFLTLPATLAFSWNVVLHFAFGGLGAYLAARRFGAGRTGALYAGAAFELSGFLVTHVVHFNLLVGAAWMPWVAYLAAGVAERRPRAAGWLAAAFAALLLGAHPYATLMNAALAGAVVVGHGGRSVRGSARPLGVLLGAGVLGAVVAAVQLLPTRAFLARTTRGEAVDWSFLTFGSFPPWNVFTLASPDLYGTPVDASFWGGPDWSHFAETCAYVGLLTIALAVCAIALRRDRATLLLGVVAALAGLLMLGRFTPLYRVLTWIPLFESTRLPGRFALPFTFALTMLAGLGFVALTAAVLVVLVLAAGAWREGAPARDPVPELLTTGQAWPAQMARIHEAAQHSAARLGVVCLGTVVLLGALLGRMRRPTIVAALAVAWTIGELATWGRSFNPGIDPSAVTARPPVAEVLARIAPDATPRPRIFRQGVDEEWMFRAGAPRTDLMTPGWKGREEDYRTGAWTLPPNSQLLYGIDSGEGFTSLLPLAWLEWMGLDAQPGAAPRPELTEAQADLLSIDAVVSTGSGIGGEGWQPVPTGKGDVWLSRNADPLPRVRLARSWKTIDDRALLLHELQATGYNARSAVLLDVPPPGMPAESSAGPVDVRVPGRETGPGRWEIDVPHADGAGSGALVVLSESFDPDWVAHGPDGAGIPVFRADGLFLAFVAPAGGGTVVLRHAPSSLRAGAALSVAGAALLLVLLLRRRRPGAPPVAAGATQMPIPAVATPIVTMTALLVAVLSLLAGVGDVREERMASGLGVAASRAWSGEAAAAYRAEAYEPAVALLRMASRFADHDAIIRYRLGLALRRAGRETEAIEAFRHALELDPELEAAARVLNNDAP
jgi:hypothetical protein